MSNVGVVSSLTAQQSCTSGTAERDGAEVVSEVDTFADDSALDRVHVVEGA